MRKRIFMASFYLESNTFTNNKTIMSDFLIKRGDEMLEDLACAGFLRDQGYELIPSISAEATPNGVLKLDDYNEIIGEILEPLSRNSDVDGIWINLHGSMQVEYINCGEAFLVSQMREIVGPNVPISVILDMHANFSYTFSKMVNIVVGYRTAPHTDIEDCYMQAAVLLDKSIKEKELPWNISVKIPITMPGEFATTDQFPVNYVMEQLNEIDKIENVWRSSFFTGMTWIDCTHGRATITVSATGKDRECVSTAISELALNVWEERHNLKLPGKSYEPIDAVLEADKDLARPIFISDSGDNITAGGSGDSAYFVELLLQTKVKDALVAGLIDPAAIAKCDSAGIGSLVSLSLGGANDPDSVIVELSNVEVKHIHRDARGNANGALISAKGLDIIVLGDRTMLISGEVLSEYGADYRNYHIIVVKLGYLFPELAKISQKSFMTMSKGSTMLDIKGYSYYKLKRPLYPLEDDFEYDPNRDLG